MSDSNAPVCTRVLLVEDSPVNQKLIGGLLKRVDCQLTVANNGQEAMDCIAVQDFDLVLMDVQMPVMDGLTATGLIREHEEGTAKHTPIIGLTAGVDRQACLDAGMDQYMSKPVRPKMLYQMLDQISCRSSANI